MLKMPMDARKATEATGGVLDSTPKRVKEHDAAGKSKNNNPIGDILAWHLFIWG